MKNELGIEVCCENCHNKQYNMCVSEFGIKCKAEGMKCFITSDKAYEQRIKELQKQQLSREELQFIKNRLDEVIEEWDVIDMVFMAHQIFKKIERLDDEQ